MVAPLAFRQFAQIFVGLVVNLKLLLLLKFVVFQRIAVLNH